MYSTPKSSNLHMRRVSFDKGNREKEMMQFGVMSEEMAHARAIFILVSNVKKAFANCSPSIVEVSLAGRGYSNLKNKNKPLNVLSIIWDQVSAPTH